MTNTPIADELRAAAAAIAGHTGFTVSPLWLLRLAASVASLESTLAGVPIAAAPVVSPAEHPMRRRED